MRLAPRSLFGRLMLVLASGLVLAQLASIAINLHERDSLVAHTTGLRQAQRIADIVKLLDPLDANARALVVGALDAPPLVVSFLRRPPAAGPDVVGGAHAAMFATVLRSAIGDDRPIRVTMGPRGELPPHALPRGAALDRLPPGAAMMGPGPMPGPGPGPMMGPGPGRFGAGGAWILALVRLHDGAWVAFDTRAPESAAGVPWRMLATLAFLLVAVLLLSWFGVRLVTRPLHVLASAADELGHDLHRPPLPEHGPAEVGRAARAFNTMQRRLVRMIEERMQLLTAMSHDLKTPITRMRLRAELLDDAELRGKFEGDLLEMEAMVTQTLEFMRGLSSHEPEEPVDVAAVLEEVRTDNAGMGRHVTVHGTPAAAYVGAPRLLKRCIGNLVDNAILYGRQAQITVEDTPQALEIRVRDQGPGIPEAQLERVFEPFYRLEGSRNRATGGTGLGLSIARNIARAHRGEVRLRNAAGGGLEAVLTLPRH